MMYRSFLALCIGFMSPFAMASDIAFKPPFAPHISAWHLGFILMAFLAIFLSIARKHKSRAIFVSTCQLIEKKHLNNKTMVYIIAVQNQRFLLADNQQSLALHALETENAHAS